ncbi:hypothetical protein K505DRAFT_128003 [Melanomma pulvis-pyrius CBS 109.77]|uniref:Uncharacterized protein n=1 Tax=Melanomma pulvis-pyrius CBS 109.77 TaxID=1314802 RepID=A0A6A6WTG9_9PLEO|nr:hypothetical protein K505DRAFT_128003 [Melanomma pulvis-pyrius CBS 109.77]
MEPPPRSPTPTPPPRHPYHRLHPHPLPPRPESLEGMVPPPLSISKRSRTHSPPNFNAVHVAVFDIPHYAPPSTAGSSPPPSPTWSRSSRSSRSCTSTPASSAPSSPTSRPRALTYSSSPSPSSSSSSSSSFSSPSPTPSHWRTPWAPAPRRALRRKTSPRLETLRSLRAKDSDACLQRIYDQQTSAYLLGNIFPRLDAVWED